MQILQHPARTEWPSLVRRPVSNLYEIREAVSPVLVAVRNDGDRALQDYTMRFDGIELDNFRVSRDEIVTASSKLDDSLKEAIKTARANISSFHRAQVDAVSKIETTSGVTCWRKSMPIDTVGLYIPGGSAPLFSTVLMLAEPANIAGCHKLVLCTPPAKDGSVHPAILYAAELCGVHEIFSIGGAQAIAALAYGTQTVPKVDKIFGPGNQYVTAAKQLVQQEGMAIDMPAGPSEVAVIADDSSDPGAVAADLIAQAEHGADSQVYLLTDSMTLAEHVNEHLTEQLAVLPRRVIAEKAIENSRAIVFDNLKTALDFSNTYAPEHLIINTVDYNEIANGVTTAGSVFLGPWTPESLGDYASGTNHTLPTNGFARSYSGVSLDSFVKKITFQEASRAGLENIAETVTTLAANEQLDGHKRAVTIRLENKN